MRHPKSLRPLICRPPAETRSLAQPSLLGATSRRLHPISPARVLTATMTLRNGEEMRVAASNLLKGALYSLEQCGHLLKAAVLLYKENDYSTAVGAAMLA